MDGPIYIRKSGDTPGVGNPVMVSDTDPMPVKAVAGGGPADVNVSKINAVTPLMGAGNTGTGSLRVTLATDQAALTNALLVTAAGDVAHDGVDSGNPVKIGGKTVASLANISTTADRTDASFTKDGRIITAPYANPENLASGATTDVTDTTVTTVIANATSGIKLYITHILVMNSHATVGTWVNLREETSGTILYTVYAAPGGGGASVTLPAPLVVPTAAKALQMVNVTTGVNVRVSASGFKAP